MNFRLLLIASLAAAFSGCAAVMPNIEPDENLTEDRLDKSVPIPCVTNDYERARQCAQLSIMEFSETVEAIAKLEGFTALTLLSMGTIGATATGFDLDEDVLKSTAVVTGSVLGLRSVSNPDARRVVLEQGLKELKCALRAAEVVHSTASPPSRQEIADDVSPSIRGVTAETLVDLHSSASFSRVGLDTSGFEYALKETYPEMEDAVAVYASIQMQNALAANLKAEDDLRVELSVARAKVGAFLGSAVIDIRAKVRTGLSGSIEGIGDLAKTQSDRITELLRGISEGQEELEQTAGDSNMPNISGLNTITQQSLVEFKAVTASVDEVYKSCVGDGGGS